MRKVLLIAALLALAFTCQAQYVPTTLAAQQHGGTSGITIVQHRSTFCLGVTSCALSFSSSVGSGHLLGYFIQGTGCSLTTDNNSNTVANALTYAGGSHSRIDYVSSSNSGSTAVTAGGCTLGDIHLHIWEVSGLAGTFDKQGVIGTSGTALSVSTSSGTTAANEIVFGFFSDGGTSNTFTIGSGFTASETTNDTSSNDASFSEAQVVSTTGTKTATATAATSATIDEMVVTFK